ncbi:MAG: aminotransferase class V-fold PLP-dependent enzyme, partial [Vicinamibacteria bacterium]
MTLIPSQRHLFSVPDDVAYFNAAYYSPQLNASTARLEEGVRLKGHPWNTTTPDFFRDAETIRALSAKLFGGDSDGYALIPAASYGVSTAARAIEPRLKSGDRILVVAEEFPSNVMPWRRTAQETGAAIVTVPTPTDGNWTEAVLRSVTSDIRVVAMSTCHWTNGARIDLAPIGEACRNAGAILVIDATQTLG